MRKGECFATSVRKASRRLTQLYDSALAPSGLRSTQFSIMADLAIRTEAPTLTELAEAMVSDRSSLGHTLRPLIRDGYVALLHGNTDRRTQRIVLTAYGQSKVQVALPLWQAAQEALIARYGHAWTENLRAVALDVAHECRSGLAAGDEEP